LYFVITAKVLDTAAAAAVKPSSTEEAAFLPQSSRKSSDQSDWSSVNVGAWLNSSPVISPTWSTSMDREDPEDAYILLDECFSGPASMSPKLSSSLASTPSPENTLSGRSAPLGYIYPDTSRHTSGDGYLMLLNQESVHSPHSNLRARKSVDGLFEGTVQPESVNSMDVEVHNGYFTAGTTNLEGVGISKSDDSDIPPALPAKVSVTSDVKMSIASGVEYDVPMSSSPVHASASQGTLGPVHGSPAATPPRPHMAVQGRMHRYVNTAPVVVARSQTPATSALPQNYAKSSSVTAPVAGYVQVTQQSRLVSSPLPPKSHGQSYLVSVYYSWMECYFAPSASFKPLYLHSIFGRPFVKRFAL